MIVHRLGVLAYEKARKEMDKIHKKACEDKQNHLIMIEHLPVFTVGKDAWHTPWKVKTEQADRGGSITCHSPGQNIYYFCFQAPNPARFFRKILQVYTTFLHELDEDFFYDKQNPGFYIQNRKVASLGFRYQNGVSLHGVALNVDVDLAFHSQVNPCNLPDILPTSLHNEGIFISVEEVNQKVLQYILELFDESL